MIIQNIANTIKYGYYSYLSEFKSITKRAKQRFEQRDWHVIHSDSQERLLLYKNKVQDIARLIKQDLKNDSKNATFWLQIKNRYANFSEMRNDYEIAETFFNSVIRKVFGTIGADADIMFLFDENEERKMASAKPIFRTYWNIVEIKKVVKKILTGCHFKVAFAHLERDIDDIVSEIEENIFAIYKPSSTDRLEILESVFYRNKGAYIIGRMCIQGTFIPFVIPLLHEEKGIFVDTFISDTDNMSIIFSFSRSYFMTEVAIPSELVAFLRTLMPQKPIAEIYNSIGFNKHGKTEFYRDFVHHLQTSNDKFVIAPGIKGMVMCVFLLPSYNIVFKLIKDKFDPPKTMNKKQVKSKYKLVSRHDRVGRMADTHEFEHFTFNKNRFSPELLEELQKVVPSLLKINGNELTIKHLYTERKMIPLNMYLENANDEDAKEAVGEYGNAIKQLAAANIFPGDMLLKNFGVTRHRRVVFYDYDEICFLTDCNFRRIPEPRDYYQEFASDTWYSVGPNDMFPEEFRKFLIGKPHIRKMFYELHNDIFDVKFWKQMQQKQIDGEVVDVFAYRRKRQFRNRHL